MNALDSVRRPVLEARQLNAGYGSLTVVRDLDLVVSPGEMVALLGPNGAGKTTTIMTLAGVQRALAGEVLLKGTAAPRRVHQRVRGGLAVVTERRTVLTTLTLEQNLTVAKVSRRRVLALFPELEAHLGRKVGDLSGGQQQMVALARALATEPSVLLADELSLGLAPLLVDRLLMVLRTAVDNGLGVLLVEQHVRKVLDVADRVVVMKHGRVELTGEVDSVRGQLGDIEAMYLG